jgi:hypothetical protein
MSARKKIRPPTAEQLAAVKFEPLPGLAAIPTDGAGWFARSEQLRQVMIFACRIVERDKPQLTQLAADAWAADAKSRKAMVKAFHEAAEDQKATVAVLEAAHVRALVALAAATIAVDAKASDDPGGRAPNP